MIHYSKPLYVRSSEGELKALFLLHHTIDGLKGDLSEVLGIGKDDIGMIKRVGYPGEEGIDDEEVVEVEELVVVDDDQVCELKWNAVLEVVLEGSGVEGEKEVEKEELIEGKE
eukprot:TRINITY_DN1764_c0_g2_i1.p1 TRINITY_DN1764_c0_g2~~TRINITY_DN1764_c0_g2_i1.p1  ORF type:complete len:113 (+),score=36.90 TRINITY_DN1764_c0_g2_i1:273-611(+)